MVVSLPPSSALVARLESGLETPDDAMIVVLAELARCGHLRAIAFFEQIDGWALYNQLVVSRRKHRGRAPPWVRRCLTKVRRFPTLPRRRG